MEEARDGEGEGEEKDREIHILSDENLVAKRREFEEFLKTIPQEEKGPKLKIRGKQHRGTDVLAEKKKRKRNQQQDSNP